MSDFNNIISVLDSINKGNTISLYVPSLKREVLFKGITTGQQKTLLKSAIDNPVFQTRFIMATHDIIVENCTEKEILSQLTFIDSLAILIQYRVGIYGPEYIVEQENKKYKIDLSLCVTNLKNIILPSEQSFTEGAIVITVGVPSFADQYLLEKQVREKTMGEQSTVTINDTIGEAFIGEVSKFIKSIAVTVNGLSQDLEYKSLSFPKKYMVLEKLPTTVVKQILKYLETVATIQHDLLHTNGVDTTDSTIKEIDFVIDSSLFALN